MGRDAVTPGLGEALTDARNDVVGTIIEGMLEEGFFGVTGDALVGKTTLARKAKAYIQHREDAHVVWVELQGAYSVAKLAARWRHALLTALIGPIAASHVAGLPRDLWPGKTVKAALAARELLGDAYEAALSEQPEKGDRTRDFEQVVAQTIELAERGRCVLVIDHVEAPLLTYKHPIKPHDLLWQVRAAAQHAEGLNVTVLCNRDTAEGIVAGPEGAFYGDGRWLTIAPPTHTQWQAAAQSAEVSLPDRVLELARGHVPTALELSTLVRARRLSPERAFAVAARSHHEHASRCLLHATSLHRLGAHVLVSIANGYGAYAATPDARSGDIARAVRQLVLGGLVQRDPKDPQGWVLVDPIVHWLLAEPMNVRPIEPMPGVASEPVE